MRLIGLCGRSGSGKGMFCNTALENGFVVIDCDKVYREMVSHPSECLLEIADNFGAEVIKDNALDRRYLASIVFSDPEKLKLLNTITHKYITAEVQNIISGLPDSEIVVLDAPTLFESGMNEICDLIIGVVAPDSLCISRIMARDNITEADAISRLSNQLPVEKIIEYSDCLLYNDSTLTDFKNDSLALVNDIKEGSV